MSRINDWLLSHRILITDNPCVSPDFCLDWPRLRGIWQDGAADHRWPGLRFHARSDFPVAAGTVTLVSDPETGDRCWSVAGGPIAGLEDGLEIPGHGWVYPASFANLIALKNAVQEHDPDSCVFPAATGSLEHRSLGIGARFTSLHWPAVQWAMAQLDLSLTANQNSIPRELVFDVETMLDGRLDTCRFPFIGADVPEGHQGQSVEGMSHGSVIAVLENGFHHRRIPWGFNTDHQPVGGKYDVRDAQLVRGCLFSTYITFDLSPELLATTVPADDDAVARIFAEQIPPELAERVRARVAACGITPNDAAFRRLLVTVFPAMQKMLARDRAYAEARTAAFTTAIGRRYFRELSIDELPGLTTPDTLATMLALSEALDMPVQFVAPAFGFQKNFPFEDHDELQRRVGAAWAVCRRFGVSIGFHSGSGKSAENYRLVGAITGSALEIKTSGRYTFEMGHALAASDDPADQALWADWYAFTRELALASAFSDNEEERTMARTFIAHALSRCGRETAVFASPAACRAAMETLEPDPDHMFWFEYNFLFVLAPGGRPDKRGLGDHGPEGYAQRARFYAISDAGRLAYARRVADYICFLAETTGLAEGTICDTARSKLAAYRSYNELTADIAPA